MSGTGGIFTHKIKLKAYYDNAGGLQEGAPVRLSGVDIGNVVNVRVVSDPARRLTPVQVTMKVNTRYHQSLRKDSVTSLETAGVMGSTYIDIDSLNAMIDDLNAGKGTAGKFLKDSALYDNANYTIANVKKLTDDVNAGKGALGKLAKDEQFAAKLQNTMDKLSSITDRLEAGEGSAGRFLRDPTMYDNTNQLLQETRGLVKAIRENPKKYLTIHLKIF